MKWRSEVVNPKVENISRDSVIVKTDMERAKFEAHLRRSKWMSDHDSFNNTKAGTGYRVWILGGASDGWKRFQFTGPIGLRDEYRRFSGHDQVLDWWKF
jgi:hypothetical protein